MGGQNQEFGENLRLPIDEQPNPCGHDPALCKRKGTTWERRRKMKNVTILAVGIGGFANNYLSKMFPYHGNGFEIVGAVEPFPESCRCLEEFKSRNIPIYSDIDEFYSHHTADLAVICSPIFLHTKQTLTALKNAVRSAQIVGV